MIAFSVALWAGVNVTLRIICSRGPTVTGRFGSLSTKSPALTETVEMVTVVRPQLVRLATSERLLPTLMFPKLILEGLLCSCRSFDSADRGREAMRTRQSVKKKTLKWRELRRDEGTFTTSSMFDRTRGVRRGICGAY